MSSAFSTWIRESPSLLAFPMMLTLHAIGMGLAAGINAALALRILGVARGVPLAEMQRFSPVMWAGFWLNAASGESQTYIWTNDPAHLMSENRFLRWIRASAMRSSSRSVTANDARNVRWSTARPYHV